jgi:hypothetical protein
MGSNRLCGRPVNVDYDHVRTLIGQAPRVGLANAVATAGDDGNSAFKAATIDLACTHAVYPVFKLVTEMVMNLAELIGKVPLADAAKRNAPSAAASAGGAD